jgi:hypothetical protein
VSWILFSGCSRRASRFFGPLWPGFDETQGRGLRLSTGRLAI